ncbi:Serpentine receptor class alpha-6 [Frankliniella fusca]|uniref:Serpentine receptor class alpha-6 n=1 Tax=Frankliniella fusca TaxID=407009 RepID=A0AAE1HDC6_9NEOP|nr:Serpentine receptor class alpha-6 [Frankliniella fusca]
MYHNIQSMTKHIDLVRNDNVFMSSDILIFGETWSLQQDTNHLKSFKILAKTNSGQIRKPRGISIHIKKTFNQLSVQNKKKKGSIDIAQMKIRDLTIVGIYATPKADISLWQKFLNTIRNLQHTKCIVVGDFNINHLKLSKKKKIMNIFLQRYNFNLRNNSEATTHSNTAIDWIISNTKLKCGTCNSFFSHHYPLWIKKACNYLQFSYHKTS